MHHLRALNYALSPTLRPEARSPGPRDGELVCSGNSQITKVIPEAGAWKD